MEKASQIHGFSSSSFLCLVDISLYSSAINTVHNFFSIFLSNPGKSKANCEKKIPDSAFTQQERFSSEIRDDGKLSTDEVKFVMRNLGLFSSPESEEFHESYGPEEISQMLEEQEPNLEEVKQAFDVFDENKDGFIEAGELQRVLCILGLKEANELENCQKMIRRYDENGDGRIDFNEFVRIMENSFY